MQDEVFEPGVLKRTVRDFATYLIDYLQLPPPQKRKVREAAEEFIKKNQRSWECFRVSEKPPDETKWAFKFPLACLTPEQKKRREAKIALFLQWVLDYLGADEGGVFVLKSKESVGGYMLGSVAHKETYKEVKDVFKRLFSLLTEKGG